MCPDEREIGIPYQTSHAHRRTLLTLARTINNLKFALRSRNSANGKSGNSGSTKQGGHITDSISPNPLFKNGYEQLRNAYVTSIVLEVHGEVPSSMDHRPCALGNVGACAAASTA